VIRLGSGMSSADLATVVIACPNCGTRYQVPYGTIGAEGREVQCAQCGKPWHATADAPLPPPEPAAPPKPPARIKPQAPVDDDALFYPKQEAELDAAFEAEASTPPAKKPLDPDHARTLAEIRAAIAPKPKPQLSPPIDPALLSKTRRAFNARQASLTKMLPMARMRRLARIVGAAIFAFILLFGIFMRTELVRWYPQLAGLYAAVGLAVNVTGLEFTDAKTVTALRSGKTVMQITAKIRSVTNQLVSVPPVQVSLFDASDAIIYEWTVTPQAAEMAPGDVLDFSTEVNAPPQGAVRVRLTFNNRGPAAPTP